MMDYLQLCRLRDELLGKKSSIPKAALKSFEKSFEIEYAHNSTAIEGNTLDGNGRTARLIMNYQLMSNKFLPVSIAKEKRLEYFNSLEEYAVNGNLEPFADMIAALEAEKLEEYLTLVPPASAQDRE